MKPSQIRSIAFLLAILALYVFGEHNLYTLIALTLGSAAMLLASQSEYRPACVLGMLVVVVAASSATSLTTLTELGSLINAAIGLFLPVIVVIWYALVTSSREAYWRGQKAGPVLTMAGYALICIFSVPIFMAMVSLVSPIAAVRFSEFEEISMILLFEALGAVFVSFKEVRPRQS